MSEEHAKSFITDAVTLRSKGSKERAVIENFVSHVRGMFPDSPAWVAEHIREAEAQVAYAQGTRQRRAFVDNVVGYTTIEYEHDLRKPSVFKTGYRQVREHLAGMLNGGAPQDKLRGVLSDTVQWRVYRIGSVGGSLPYGPDDVQLAEEAVLDVSGGDRGDPERMLAFLATHLGREGARRLAAETVAADLGFDSVFAGRHQAALTAVVDDALAARPDYADIIRDLWTQFAGYTGGQSTGFDRDMYVTELYVVTLAKLLCANVVAGRALHSDEAELQAILNGTHFMSRGLDNLVEYDYFGWLNAEPYVQRLLPVAEDMQRGLRSFDFESPAAEDLFGQMMAQLAGRFQRVLLGQEWTPPWLAARMAHALLDALPADQRPRFLDICCGSGATIVEVVKAAKERLPAETDDPLDELSRVAAGFDIDPLAVMLAKVNWVVAMHDQLDGARHVSIPIYHADSMFAKTPVSVVGENQDSYELVLHKHTVQLPAFLVTPQFRALFDALLDISYAVAMAAAEEPHSDSVKAADIDAALDEALAAAEAELDDNQRGKARSLMEQLTAALEQLQRDNLNGIWAFVLRNSYRPGLLAGQFNGLITNPPWLALSKLADNPYQAALQRDATAYGIKPAGAAHLHTELATTFLLHAVSRYLTSGAVIACILPETVLNGYHHELFREAAYASAGDPVALDVTGLWRVTPGTFKNEAIVLHGRKRTPATRTSIPGKTVSDQAEQTAQFAVIKLGSPPRVRTAWSDAASSTSAGWFDELEFRQGADLMPRTTVFHDVSAARRGNMKIAPIDAATGSNAYLLTGGHKLTSFRITRTTVPDKLIYDALISKHLAPFHLADPAKALLPFERSAAGAWTPVTPVRLAASRSAKAAFDEILKALSKDAGHAVNLADYQAAIDTRRKLSNQVFTAPASYLVVYGAGGSRTTAAYAPLSRFALDRLVIDQTLYWLIVDTEDEAIYTAGLFNSPAIDELIADFQARGAFGRRHVHKLPTVVTPEYDPAQALHAAVVRATRDLLDEFAARRGDAATEPYFDPNRGLASRRGKIRTEIIETLDAYPAYVKACEALYGI